MELMKTITEKLDADVVERIAKRLGADGDGTRNAIESALPLLVAGLGRNARTGDAAAIQSALKRDHDGSVLDDLPAFLERGPGPRDDRIVDHVFGERRARIERDIAHSSGLSRRRTGQLLATLAPLVMGALAKQQSGSRLAIEDVLSALNTAETEARRQPGADVLAGLLDGEAGDDPPTRDLQSLGRGLLGRFLER